jgi:hypothetical protein
MIESTMVLVQTLKFKGFTQFVSHFDKSETTSPYDRTEPLGGEKEFFVSSLTKSLPFATPTKIERITQCR